MLPNGAEYKFAIEFKMVNCPRQKFEFKQSGSQWLMVNLKLLAPLFATSRLIAGCGLPLDLAPGSQRQMDHSSRQ